MSKEPRPMEPSFKIVPCLNSSSSQVITVEDNSLILIVKLDNMDFGKVIKQFDELFLCQDLTSQKLKLSESGSQVLLRLRRVRNSYALVVNVGNNDVFSCRTIIEVTKTALSVAMQKECRRLIIPILPNRMTSSCLNLKGTAVLIAKSTKEFMSQPDCVNRDLEIVFWSTSQAKVNLLKGLEIVSNSLSCHDFH